MVLCLLYGLAVALGRACVVYMYYRSALYFEALGCAIRWFMHCEIQVERPARYDGNHYVRLKLDKIERKGNCMSRHQETEIYPRNEKE